uniref:Ycf17 n=1 Tax=Gracilaria hainanensis TaxID=2871843 RepID=A0AAU7YPF2_9FLOR
MRIYNQRNRWIWGFSIGSESWNGRLAMIAFVMVFCIEFFFLYL